MALILKRRVIDGDRTHDNQNHNLGLYQLSYDHRFRGCKEKHIPRVRQQVF